MIENAVWNKSCSGSIHVPVSIASLLVRKEALRNDHVQIIFCSRHCDIEETTLFLDFGRASGRKIRWDTTINAIQNENRLPLLAFC